jgi:hypothetical protein
LDFSASLSQFSLSSSFHGIPCPIYYHHLLECISQVDKKDIPQSAWICRLLVSFLMEQGLFPNMEMTEEQKHIIGILIDESCAQMEDLKLPGKQWSDLHKWSLKTALYAGIDLPQAPHFQPC